MPHWKLSSGFSRESGDIVTVGQPSNESKRQLVGRPVCGAHELTKLMPRLPT